MNIAETPKIFKHDQYDIVREIVTDMHEQNLIKQGAGFCWGISDLINQRLKNHGIESRVVECELTIVCSDPQTFITVGGHATPNQPNQIGTHVVVITNHETQPLIIDCSINHLLPDPFNYVCAVCLGDADTITHVHRGNWTLVYRPKIGSKFPALHQQNIVDRIKLDEKLQKDIKQNKYLTAGVIVLGTIVCGTIVYNRFLIKQIEDNVVYMHGKIESLDRRADRVDQGIEKLLRDFNQLEEKKK